MGVLLCLMSLSACTAIEPNHSTSSDRSSAFSGSPSPSTSLSTPPQDPTKTETLSAESSTTRSVTQTTTEEPTRMLPEFLSKSIQKVTLKENKDILSSDPNNTQHIKTIEASEEREKLHQIFRAGKWEYYPSESHWIKYWPVYAKKIVILEHENGLQTVLHLYADNSNAIAVAYTEEDYTTFIEKAVINYKNGVNVFQRYTVFSDIMAYLSDLYK